MTKVLPHILLAFAAIAVAAQLGRPTEEKAELSTVVPATSPRPVVEGGFFRGMSMQLHAGGDAFERYQHLIPEIADLGADTVLIVVPGWQEHAGSLDLRIDPNRTPHDEDIAKLFDLARHHGMRIIFMPIVLLANPRNTEWRGRIVPEDKDWDAWFRRYTEFLLHYADIAERHNVEVFMVGSELIKTEVYTDRWRKLITEVRERFKGMLGYSSNWDHYTTDKIGFWPELDYVGMTTYYKLAEGPRPELTEVVDHWGKFKSRILTFQRQVHKPIIFTEVGWCSQEGAAKEAWNYFQNQHATPEGHFEQLTCYLAFMNVWDDVPSVGGVIWWEWDESQGGENDYNYTPRGKPAEEHLRKWFKRGAASRGEAAGGNIGPATRKRTRSEIGPCDPSRMPSADWLRRARRWRRSILERIRDAAGAGLLPRAKRGDVADHRGIHSGDCPGGRFVRRCRPAGEHALALRSDNDACRMKWKWKPKW